MKTPKRDCDWCNSWELEHCGRSWCGDCERGKRMFAQSARWIRWNREARLRRKIALLTKELDRQKQIAKRQHQRDSERYEEMHQDWYELKRKYQELKKQKKGS